jgi:cobalt-zinc-cadmium efflux system membrane fusion protein
MKASSFSLIYWLAVGAVVLIACERPAADAPATGASAAASPESRALALTAAQLAELDLQTAPLDSGYVARTLRVRGQLVIPPNHRETVASLLGGVIDSVAVMPGQHVRAGQLLLRLRHPSIAELQEQWVQRNLALTQARQEYDRQQQLRQAGTGTERKWQEAEIRLQVAEAEFQLASEKLRLNRIPRPQPPAYRLQNTLELAARTAGVVARLLVHRGEAVAAGQPLLDLIDPQHVHLVLQIPEQEATAVQVGQQLRYRLAGQPDVLAAQIVLVGLKVDSTTRSVEIHAYPLGKRPVVLAGASVEAELVLPVGVQALVRPEALINTGGRSYVLAAQPPTAQGRVFRLVAVEVLAGQSSDGRQSLRLLEALHPDEQIVLRGGYPIVSELRRQAGG